MTQSVTFDFPLMYPTIHKEASVWDTVKTFAGELLWPPDKGPLHNFLNLAEHILYIFTGAMLSIILMVASFLGMSLSALGDWLDNLLGLKTVDDLLKLDLNSAVQRIMGAASIGEMKDWVGESISEGLIVVPQNDAIDGRVKAARKFPLIIKNADDKESPSAQFANQMKLENLKYTAAVEGLSSEDLLIEARKHPEGKIKNLAEVHAKSLKDAVEAQNVAINNQITSAKADLTRKVPGESPSERVTREQYARTKAQYDALAAANSPSPHDKRRLESLERSLTEKESQWTKSVEERLKKSEPLKLDPKGAKAEKQLRAAVAAKKVGNTWTSRPGDRRANVMRNFKTKGAKGLIGAALLMLLSVAGKGAWKVVTSPIKTLGKPLAITAVVAAAVAGTSLVNFSEPGEEPEKIAALDGESVLSKDIEESIDKERLTANSPTTFYEILSYQVNAVINGDAK